MDVEIAAASLELNRLPDDLVHDHWKEGYFNDETEVPPELELHLQSTNIPEILHSLSCHIFSRIHTGTLAGWPELVSEGLDFKRFLYLIHFLLCTATHSIEARNHRTNGIFAARLYFSFLAVPQGGPFLIYQSNIFTKALKMLQCGNLLRGSENQSPVRGQNRGSNFASDDLQPASSPLSRFEAEALKKILIDGMRDLLRVLEMSEIGAENEAVPLIVESLSVIAMEETIQPDLLSSGVSEATTYNSSSLAKNSFCGLLALCSEKHGEVKETVRLIMRFVFEAFMIGFKRGASTGRSNAVREVFSDFVYHLYITTKEYATEGMFILLQHLCTFAPDRAESRTKLVETSVRLVIKLPHDFIFKCSCIFVVMSCHDRASVRLFTIEVLAKLLNSINVQLVNGSPEEMSYKLHKILFAALLARIQDSSALVRSKAMSCHVSYIRESMSVEGRRYLMKEVFIDPYVKCNSIKEVPTKKFKNFNDIAKSLQRGTNLTEVYLPCGQSIVCELSRFCDDDKIMVRKSALQFLMRILHLNMKFMDKELVAEIGSHCKDEALLVRKMMVQEFTDLLLVYPSNQQLLRQWAIDVVPSIFDPEASMVDKVLESFARAILNNMVPSNEIHHSRHHLPWVLMNQISHLQLRDAFLKACSLWKEEALRSRRLISILKTHIGMDKPYNDAAWVTLKCLAEFMTLKNPQFILDFYHNEIYGIPNVSTYISQLVMEVLWLTWKQLPNPDQNSLAHELNTDLLLFKVPVPLISRAVDIRYGLHVGDREGSDVNNPPEWAVSLIKRCEDSIFELLKLSSEEVQDEEAMKRYVLTLGNVCLYYPGIIESKTRKQLLYILSPPSDELCELWCGSAGPELKAGLIVTLGKLGLQNESFAKILIETLGSMLPVTSESILKNNIMICLTDLCIRHTSLGDELLSDMCLCLKDHLPAVRENTLKLFIQLIQEDYVKMRDNLIFNLLSMLNDDDHHIVAMTRAFFVQTVLKKKSNCFTTSFISSIFHYNGYEHRRSHKVSLTPRERDTFDISGPLNQGKRRNIYRFMLSQSNDEDRFTISRHLCIQICQAVLDKKIDLEEKGEAVLRDCLFAMDCDEIFITDNKDDEDDEAPADVSDVSEQVVNLAHKKFISELVKKHVVETEIPTLSKLRKKLLTDRSALVADVMRVLKSMIRLHKIDADDVRDPQIARELKRTSRGNTTSSDEEG